MGKMDCFPIILVCCSILGLSSCANLALIDFSAFGDTTDDPVAAAAAALRRPASINEQEKLMEESRIYRGIMSRDLVLGMRMDDVMSAWGEPRNVESAGDPSFGNQRWIYSEGLSQIGSLGNARVVYFEDGRVVGWETTQPR